MDEVKVPDYYNLKGAIFLVIGGWISGGGNINEVPEILYDMGKEYAEAINRVKKEKA